MTLRQAQGQAHPSKLTLDRLALGLADAETQAHAKSCAQCSAHLEKLAVLTGGPDFVHPSRLQLDRLALGSPDAATASHAASCAQCGAHLKAVQVDLPVPQWVRDVGTSRPAAWLRWLRPMVAVGAMALVAFAVVGYRPASGPDITAKGLGTPQVQVWVNHAGKATLWSGAALVPDDAFRFEVRPGPYRHLTILELQGDRLYRVLHSAPVPSDGLSPAWAVDADGAQEDVMLLLSNAPLSDDELRRALAGEGSLWSTRWRFQKELR
ncbi:MAG: hypothetical protein JNK82_22460 [Myxococcaceae bacterium]|nr:hypothetical protein [Myxococcaceae bacterium]